jgi:two-component system chemotaxis sensor kinase CheA
MAEILEDHQELCGDFVVETRETLGNLEPLLLELERSTASSGAIDPARVDAIFRAVHSVKGSSSFLDLANLVAVAHEAESLLDLFRKGRATLESRHITVLCRVVDFVLGLLDQVEVQFNDRGREAEAQALVASIRAEMETQGPDANAADEAAGQVDPGEAGDAELAGSPSIPLESAPSREEPAANGDGGDRRRKSESGSIRVDLDKLDALMDLVGELILAETMVTHNPDLEGHHFPDFQRASLQLNRITRSIQDVAMSVRMVPISGTFRKMLRLVRDLAQKQGKEVELKLAGEGTEIDKTVVEAIADPLVHIVRNAVDHGIETPSVRVAAGKPAIGRLRMEASHEGGEIRITIVDDGKGLDRDAILAKARAKGLVDPSRSEVGEAEIFGFIFAPGFSTAAQVSDVSGRGVGMDVVRRNIDKLGGRVDVASVFGQGTTIRIRLPLTLAIVEGMLVRVGASVYTIPLLAIRESVTIKPEQVTRPGGRQEMASVRGQLLPILRLHELHGIPSAETVLESGILVVVEEHNRCFAIFVDALIGQRQTVIKALPAYLGSLPGISGCSILGNGDISLILDVKALQGEWAAGAES